MTVFDNIIYFISKITITTPTSYGWFHIVSFIIVIATTIAISIAFKNCNDKTFRTISLIFWITIVVLEIIKQFLFSFVYNEETATCTYVYPWWDFPYQFCSSPLYVLPLVIFLKDCKLRDCAISFISLYSLFAGVSVMFYPETVFNTMLFINIQTMVHHGTQVVLGVFFIVYYRKKINILYFLKAIVIFVPMAIIAILLNEIIPHITTVTFNMWFISRLYPSTLPVLSTVYSIAPYPVFLIAYFIGFSALAFLINLLVLGIMKLVQRNKKTN